MTPYKDAEMQSAPGDGGVPSVSLLDFIDELLRDTKEQSPKQKRGPKTQ